MLDGDRASFIEGDEALGSHFGEDVAGVDVVLGNRFCLRKLLLQLLDLGEPLCQSGVLVGVHGLELFDLSLRSSLFRIGLEDVVGDTLGPIVTREYESLVGG
jgi:hypothetical protein